jgi:glycosyltransferase involved in cell wall biosynthesis
LLNEFTLCVPHYRQPHMLREQLAVWEHYPSQIQIILVDDGSPEVAADVVRLYASHALRRRITLFRVTVDVSWNRGGCRNLAAREATTQWICQIDIDHILKPDSAARLLAFEPDPAHWYRFRRFRVGAADDTRKKDTIPREATYGEIKPHIDSYLVKKSLYWRAGGYSEDFSGCLGGGSPFLAELGLIADVKMLPDDIALHVYTTDVVSDASVRTLSRDTTEYQRRKAAMRGKTKGMRPVRFPYVQESLF